MDLNELHSFLNWIKTHNDSRDYTTHNIMIKKYSEYE